MGCSLRKSYNPNLENKRHSIITHTLTPDKKPSLDVFNPILGKVVSVPILVPASKSSIVMRRSTQLTIGQ
ncbi:unnamed protein product [Paramecium pentaurelia]|uniref:Uncharacterized protein n=1 Tax=Paramecium pentaurelia TaxID=43138 RepID=A0A8S1SV73_9CILI|nr:unnamed protein product [Paramecium pentaurelia]